MKKIIFVCHGNICRSVAAEYIMKSLTNNFIISSRATSLGEIGNDIYLPMKKELIRNSIPFDRHYANIIAIYSHKIYFFIINISRRLL